MAKLRQPHKDDPVMARIRVLWAAKQQAGWTQQQLGEAMGYGADSARQSVSQFLKTHDPKASMIRRVATAFGIAPGQLFAESKR